MSKIYIPSSYINNCNVIYDNYIRSYTDNTYTEWVDIFVHQDYMEQLGRSTVPESPICDTLNSYTTDEHYKLGYYDNYFPMFILAFVFALFLFNIRRFARYESS